MQTRRQKSAARGEDSSPTARCEVCGNEYDKVITVVAAGRKHVFDCFECAVHAMAPVCEHCGCKVIGHGVEVGGLFFCCAHCARESAGTREIKDRVEVA